MTEHEKIEQVLRNYVTSGLIEHNAEKFLAYVSDDIIGFGIGEQGFVSSKKDMKAILDAGIKADQGASYELNFKQIDIRIHHHDTASLCAQIMISRTCAGTTTKSGLQQTLTLRREAGEWRICAIHASPLLLSGESIEGYPLKFADNTLTHMRTELQSEAFDLINKNFSGGVLTCRVQDDGRFPLCFVNDSMLDYLQYSREELFRMCSTDTMELVHREDRAELRKRVVTALEQGTDYEIRYRVFKKDGKIIWILGRGRSTIDEKGDKVLINVLMDVTEMVHMQDELEKKAQELKEQSNAIAVSEERFRIALEKTSNIIFDYDIISGTILHSGAPTKFMDFVTNVGDAAKTLINSGEITHETLPDFQAAFSAIQEGATQAECVVKVRLATGGELWHKIAMTGISDSDGRAVRAIGMIEDITRQKEAEIAYAREERYRLAILANALASYDINFSKGQFEDCRVQSPLCQVTRPGEPYDEFMYRVSKTRLNEAEGRTFMDTFSRVNALSAFERGETELEQDYQAFNPDGSSTWMRTTLRTMLDITTNELKGFLYVTDIDKKKRAELELTRKSERDPMTGLYNKGTSETRIQERLKRPEEVQTGVFMILDVDYFKNINDTYGHPFGDMVLTKTARVLSETFRESDIVGRLGGDEFCVFFSGMRSRHRVELAAETLCKGVQSIFAKEDGKPGATCSIGITTCNGVMKSFEQAYKEADQALYSVKQNGRNGYAFFGEKPKKNTD